MKEKTCCFTGHRVIPTAQQSFIKEKLEKTVIKFIEEGYRYFGAGGALGFDTLAAQVILNLKNSIQ